MILLAIKVNVNLNESIADAMQARPQTCAGFAWGADAAKSLIVTGRYRVVENGGCGMGLLSAMQNQLAIRLICPDERSRASSRN